MHYRFFEPDDFDDLYAIEEICFQPPQRFSRRYMRELTSSPDAATWIAAESSRYMAGFAIVEWAQQISGIIAYIDTIEVLPGFRGRGIAAELMRRLEGSANAERAITIWLHVDAENAPAIRLYERLGYHNTGRADHFYARNRPAAIYAKGLQNQTSENQ
ncbi:MAG TPA: N-acetyltransferase [Terracidiphilus sp.]|jgi:ribosomal protein S18 acetylase RimI-like enzyme